MFVFAIYSVFLGLPGLLPVLIDGWFSLNQSSFLVLLQVLHLNCQVSKERYSVPPVLFLPLRDMLVLEHVGILPDVLAALEGVALLDVVRCDEFVVFSAYMVHTEVD